MAAGFARNMTRPSRIRLLGKWILSLVILLGPAVVIGYAMPETPGLGTWAIYAGVWVVALIIGRYVEFCPDYDDLGWFGGLADDPFSWTDNQHRSLLWCKLFFVIPGFVVDTFADTLDAAKAGASSPNPR